MIRAGTEVCLYDGVLDSRFDSDTVGADNTGVGFGEPGAADGV